MTDQETLKAVHEVCNRTLELIQQQPTTPEMELLINNSIKEHYEECPAARAINGLQKKTAENTAVIRLITKARDSITPKNTKDYSGWIKLVLVIVAAILSGLGIDVAVN